jgi:transposase
VTEQQLLRMAKHRLAILRHAEEITGNVALTCRYYGISRQVFYKWRQRYDQHGLDRLRDRAHRPRVCPNQTRTEVVGKIIYLRQHYHFGPAKIAMYLRRYHDIQISHSGVWRVLKQLDLNRLPASQRYKRHDRRWQRYENPCPATGSKSTSSSSRPWPDHAASTTSSPPSTTAPACGSCASTPSSTRRRPSSSPTMCWSGSRSGSRSSRPTTAPSSSPCSTITSWTRAEVVPLAVELRRRSNA